MKNSQLFFLLFIVLLTSCKDTTKQDTNSIQTDTLGNKNSKPQLKDTFTLKNNTSFLSSNKLIANNRLKQIIKEKIDSVEAIDFTGDNIADFICKTKPNSEGLENEYWVSSNYKIIKTKNNYSEGYHFRWFVNLDNDPEPEIFEAIGDEDGIDYTISNQDLINGVDKVLLYLNPIIIENNKRYWGYPWDILNIITRTNNKNIELFCSLNHNIIRDGNEENNPKNQKQMPVLFFAGHHSQESEQKNINDEKWLSLNNIVELTKR